MSFLQIFNRARQQFVEQRRSKRHQVQCPAWIEYGAERAHDVGGSAQRRDCTVCDVSEHGARIAIESPDILPMEFWLAIAHDGSARRRCRVIWRSTEEVGVCYLGPSIESQID